MAISVPDFDHMFHDGARYQWRGGREAVVTVVQAGDLVMPSGQLTACDPFTGLVFEDQAAPFTVAVAPGRYPVLLALVAWTEPGKPVDEFATYRNAAAKLVVGSEPAIRWHLAITEEQAQTPVDPADGKSYGYSVDSGTGSFLDRAALTAVAGLAAQFDGRLGESPLSEALNAAGFSGAVNLPSPDGEATIIAFMSGPGDGCFPTWIGYDAADRPTCFVTEFEYLRQAQPIPQ
ncbi:MAG TPA: DUF4241 domain-containing protein [Actinocrinis sp.]|nr:DUF4241 domain-containing protein [Actinocrinis sp.]